MSLRIDGISKRFRGINQEKFYALNNINITMDNSGVLALIGQNGAGKTTLIKCLLGFLKPEEGIINIDSLDVNELIKNNHIGYMPEKISNIDNVTGREYINSMLILRGMKIEDINEKLDYYAKRLYVNNYLDIPMSHCSKGNFKKIIFIQSIIHEPKLLILDEPTDGLDPISRRAMLDCINDLKKKNGYIIITTHLLSDLERVADVVTVLLKGEVLAQEQYSNIGCSMEDWYIRLIMESGKVEAL